MKKLISGLMVAATVAGALMPLAALAQGPAVGCTLSHDIEGFTDQGCTDGADLDESNLIWGVCCILDAVYTVTDWIFYFLVIIVALLVIWGGFSIATAAGAPDKVAAGRNAIMYAMIGLAIALLSRAIPALVTALIS